MGGKLTIVISGYNDSSEACAEIERNYYTH